MSDSLSLTSSVTMPVLQDTGLFSPPDIHIHNGVYILYMYICTCMHILVTVVAIMNECCQQMNS